MIPKPPACSGCPFERTGAYFVPDDPDRGQRVAVVAQNPGPDEEHGQRFLGWSGGGERYETVTPRAAIGKTGYELDRYFLPRAGLERADVRMCNVIRCRVRGGNELPPVQSKVFRAAAAHCQRTYWQPLAKDVKVIALGAHALWALTGESGADDESDDADDARANRGIVGWRGWTRPYRPQWGAPPSDHRVFITFHPAYYFRAHWMKPVGRRDWTRIGRWLRGEWPEPSPSIDMNPPREWPAALAYDTEYVPAGDGPGRLLRASLAWRDAQGWPMVHVVEAGDLYGHPPGPVPRVIAHNYEADVPFTARVFGTVPREWEDTMYAHSVLHGTLRHGLDFLGSLYARTDRWKHLEQSDPITYAGLDALGTWDVWRELERELAADPESAAIYHDELKSLLPHLLRRPSIRLHQGRLAAHAERLAREQAAAAERGQVAAGWPLNVASADQVGRWIGVKG